MIRPPVHFFSVSNVMIQKIIGEWGDQSSYWGSRVGSATRLRFLYSCDIYILYIRFYAQTIHLTKRLRTASVQVKVRYIPRRLISCSLPSSRAMRMLTEPSSTKYIPSAESPCRMISSPSMSVRGSSASARLARSYDWNYNIRHSLYHSHS